MRRALVLLIASTAALADRLQEVGSVRLDAAPLGMVPLEVNGSALTVVLLKVGEAGKLAVFDAGGKMVAQAPTGKGACALAPCPEGFVVCEMDREKATTYRYVRRGSRFDRQAEQSLDMRADPALQVLSFGAMENGRVMFAASGADLFLQTWDPEGTRSGVLSRPGRTFLAATTSLVDPDADQTADFFLITSGPGLIRLRKASTGLEAIQDYPFRADGFTPCAVCADGNELYVAGHANGEARLLLLDPQAAPAVHKIKDIFRDGSTARRDPVASVGFGPGAFSCAQAMGPEGLVLAGTREGKAWVGIAQRGRDAGILSEVTLRGAAVKQMAVNRTCVGWCVAALTDDNILHFLCRSSDPRLPGGWDPWGGTGGGSLPPGPPEEPGRAGADLAVFPHIEVDRRDLDTVLYVVNMGRADLRLTFSFFDDGGRRLVASEVPLRPMQRTRVSCAQMLAERRISSFYGYLVMEGGNRRDLVAEAILTAGDSAMILTPHWR